MATPSEPVDDGDELRESRGACSAMASRRRSASAPSARTPRARRASSPAERRRHRSPRERQRGGTAAPLRLVAAHHPRPPPPPPSPLSRLTHVACRRRRRATNSSPPSRGRSSGPRPRCSASRLTNWGSVLEALGGLRRHRLRRARAAAAEAATAAGRRRGRGGSFCVRGAAAVRRGGGAQERTKAERAAAAIEAANRPAARTPSGLRPRSVDLAAAADPDRRPGRWRPRRPARRPGRRTTARSPQPPSTRVQHAHFSGPRAAILAAAGPMRRLARGRFRGVRAEDGSEVKTHKGGDARREADRGPDDVTPLARAQRRRGGGPAPVATRNCRLAARSASAYDEADHEAAALARSTTGAGRMSLWQPPAARRWHAAARTIVGQGCHLGVGKRAVPPSSCARPGAAATFCPRSRRSSAPTPRAAPTPRRPRAT